MPGSSLVLAVLCALGSSGPRSDSSAPDAGGVLERWVRRALAEHPDALVVADELRADRAEVAGARAWMPPDVRMQYQSDGRVDLALSQMVPGFGKRGAEAGVRVARVGMARLDSVDRARAIDLAVREAAWMEWMAWRKHGVLVAQESSWNRQLDARRRILSQGMSSSSEAWLARARSRQARAESEKALAEARAASAMREQWTGQGDGPLDAPAARPPDWDSAAVLGSVGSRPDVAAMEAEASMREAMAVSMGRSLRPDFMVGAMAMRMPDGMPGWGIMAGVTLPFVPWADGMPRSGAEAERMRSRADRGRAESMRRMGRSEAIGHMAKAEAAWRTLRELDSLVLPGQEAALAETRSRYAQGIEMLPMVFAMEDMVRMTRMERIMARGEYEIERARLFAAAGLETPFDGGAP